MSKSNFYALNVIEIHKSGSTLRRHGYAEKGRIYSQAAFAYLNILREALTW